MPISIAVLILRIASLGMLGFAFVWALAPFDSVNTPAIWLIDILDWPFDGNVTEFNRYEQWFSAVASSFLIGFALLFLLLICPLLEQGNSLARRAGLISISIWFITDSLGSYASGVPVNVIWNSMFVLPFFIPLMFVKFDLDNGT